MLTKPSYCRICEPLCGILVDVEDAKVTGIRGDPDHPASRATSVRRAQRWPTSSMTPSA